MTTREWRAVVDRGATALAEYDMEGYATFVPSARHRIPESAQKGYRIKAERVLRAALSLPPADPHEGDL